MIHLLITNLRISKIKQFILLVIVILKILSTKLDKNRPTKYQKYVIKIKKVTGKYRNKFTMKISTNSQKANYIHHTNNGIMMTSNIHVNGAKIFKKSRK